MNNQTSIWSALSSPGRDGSAVRLGVYSFFTGITLFLTADAAVARSRGGGSLLIGEACILLTAIGARGVVREAKRMFKPEP